MNEHRAGAPALGDPEGERRQSVPGNDPRRNVPIANFNHDDRRVNLNANWDDNRNPNYAVPARLGVFDFEACPAARLEWFITG